MAIGRMRAHRPALVAAGFLLLLALLSLFAPLLAPHAPNAQPDIVRLSRLPPSLTHFFGTDNFSRDVLSRVMFGGRVSLGVATFAVLLSVSIGTTYGAVAGYLGGAVDSIMMRVIDALLAIPRVLLLILALALWGRVAIPALVLLLGLTGWFGMSRLVRGQVRSLARQEFALAARALGARRRRVLWRHLLPNALSPVVVAATLDIGNVIALEAGLSYLGLGVQAPHASWGNIIQDGSDQLARAPWISLFPGLAILATSLAFNLLGDALRDALDPRRERSTDG